MKHNKYTSLIVTYNSADVVPFLLADLFSINSTGPVIIIDNASMDQTVEIIKQQFPQALLIQNTENLGYAKAVNQGFEFCDTPYVFVLNPDIRIPSASVITAMVDYMDSSPSIGSTGPLQFITDDNEMQLNFNCSYWGWRALTGYFQYRIIHKWLSPEPIQVPMLNAGCIMVRRSAFLQVGKLNPKYFLYGEDPDLGLKFIRFGFQSVLLTNISVIHYREKSLQTLPADQLKRIHRQAILNVADAILIGTGKIIIDRITLAKNDLHTVLH